VSEDNFAHPEAKVCEFIQDSSKWNVSKLRQFVNNHHVTQKIKGITIPIHESGDSFCWGLNSSGSFTTKSTIWAAHDIQAHNFSLWLYKWIWNIDTLPKIKVFFWQLCHKSLPTKGNFVKRGFNINQACPLCLGNIESIEHLFKDCQMVKKVWDLAATHRWLPFVFSPTGCHNFSHYINKIYSSHNSKLEQKFSFILWSIWKSRNVIVFNNGIFNPIACLVQAKKANA